MVYENSTFVLNGSRMEAMLGSNYTVYYLNE